MFEVSLTLIKQALKDFAKKRNNYLLQMSNFFKKLTVPAYYPFPKMQNGKYFGFYFLIVSCKNNKF